MNSKNKTHPRAKVQLPREYHLLKPKNIYNTGKSSRLNLDIMEIIKTEIQNLKTSSKNYLLGLVRMSTISLKLSDIMN